MSPQKQIVRDGTIAHEGEIFQEFDEELKRFREEEERNRLKEEAASLDLIRRLQVIFILKFLLSAYAC